jgi:hypothetical protein
MRGTRELLSAASAAVLFVALVAGCGGVESLSFRNPPSTTVPAGATALTLPGNLASLQEAGIPGATTTTVPAIGPGKASITGSVFGPSGPVGGATVKADRLVGDQVASTTTTTAADGSFTIGNVLGGRFRLRAWHSPDLTMTTPQIFFLDSGQPHSLTLQLSGFSGPDIATSVNPSVMNVGRTANLLVQATTPSVGTDGVVHDQPLVGATVTLSNGPAWTVFNGNPQTTGTDGRVLFQISCSQAGDNSLSVTVGSAPAQPVATPACVQPAPPTTNCTSSTTSLGQPFVTTTTQPQSGC